MIKHDKIQHGKIQAGDTILDAEIEMEVSEPPKTTTQATGSLTSEGLTEALDALLFDHEPDDLAPPTGPWFTGMRDYLTKYPTWPVVVEGSIARPITDEGRLLK